MKVDQNPVPIDDVDHVERLAVVAVFADVIERLAHAPLRPHRHIVERHHPADAVLRVGEQGLGDLPLFSAALDAAEAKVDALRDKLTGLDIDALSPRAALDLLYELQREAGKLP